MEAGLTGLKFEGPDLTTDDCSQRRPKHNRKEKNNKMKQLQANAS